MRQFILVLLALLPVCFAGFKVLKQRPGTAAINAAADNSESEEENPAEPVGAESRYLPYQQYPPYKNYKSYQEPPPPPPPVPIPVRYQPEPLDEDSNCGCGYVIVERKQHVCYPGKSQLKVMRRPPKCSAGCLESGSAPVPQIEVYSRGGAATGAIDGGDESQPVPYAVLPEPAADGGGLFRGGNSAELTDNVSGEWYEV